MISFKAEYSSYILLRKFDFFGERLGLWIQIQFLDSQMIAIYADPNER